MNLVKRGGTGCVRMYKADPWSAGLCTNFTGTVACDDTDE